MQDYVLILSVLFLFCVAFSKFGDKYGIPALLIFIFVGMFAGSDGIGGIYFDNGKIAQDISMLCLILILFSGGFDTTFKFIKPILKEGIILATLGVVLTAFIISLLCYYTLDFKFYDALLLGAIISSTDAAAVFAIMRSKGLKLKNNITPLLELESGSNDPMAIFLTITIIEIITLGTLPSIGTFLFIFLKQFGLALVCGYIFGISMPFIINKLKFNYWGLYPVFTLAWIYLTFVLSEKIGANGYLSVYLLGIFANSKEFVYKKGLIGFFEGTAWIAQVVVFLTLGLLVFPSELPNVALLGCIIAFFIMFFARPIAVFLCLVFFKKFNFNEKIFISWVGLRGTVPIILATYPLAAGIADSHFIFNIVFFIVLTSILIQGITLNPLAKLLKIIEEEEIMQASNIPISYNILKQYTLKENSPIIGKNIAELALDENFIILLVKRNGEYIKASGSLIFEDKDLLLVLCDDLNLYKNTLESFNAHEKK
ncbi:potassium/proton antiporter [Campylobacter sp. CCS1377]|uniref:Potassium/proton antiporter n=1 Tax=Campylobacter sp. CCS1377 TaxID=3158229 RepID=A0AAU7E8P9_9BACT